MPLFSTYADADWPRLERDWTAWWNGELARPLVQLTTCRFPPGTDAKTIDRMGDHLTQFVPDAPVDQVLAPTQMLLDATHYYADAFPHWWPNYGPGITSAFLGSRVEHGLFTTWFHPVGVASLSDLTLALDSSSFWWQKVQEVTQAAVARWGRHVSVGFTDLSGNLDILAHLRGTQDLLLDLVDAPEDVARLSARLTQIWLQCYDALDALIASAGRGSSDSGSSWAPSRMFLLLCDFSYMISPKAFERFVLPDLEQCCAAIDYPYYHLDGKGALKHLDSVLALPKMRGIQWIPGDGQPTADKWPDVLRRIRAAGKLCQIIVDRQGAFSVARELGGRGFQFVLTEQLTDNEAGGLVEAFWREFAPGERVPGTAPRQSL